MDKELRLQPTESPAAPRPKPEFHFIDVVCQNHTEEWGAFVEMANENWALVGRRKRPDGTVTLVFAKKAGQ